MSFSTLLRQPEIAAIHAMGFYLYHPKGKRFEMKEDRLTDVNRRQFINSSAFFLSGMLAGFPMTGFSAQIVSNGKNGSKSGGKKAESLSSDLTAFPNFCGHEHWGSISSIGLAPEQGGFRCDTTAVALPLTPTSIWDLIVDPYEGGWMIDDDSYSPPNGQGKIRPTLYGQLWKTSPAEALKQFKSQNYPLLMTGGFQCTLRGILFQYGIDISKYDLSEWKTVNGTIQSNYSSVFDWYIKAMRKAHFSEVIRPVHPEFYVQEESPATKSKEAGIIHTITRIDPLLDLWQDNCARRDALSKITGVEPFDAASWREFIKRIFDLAARNHTVGIKQLQAYRRSLQYEPRTDAEVIFRGKLDAGQVLKFQDWVMHECCKQAHERNWVHQVHVGTNNITESSPMPLKELAERYSQMKLVMIHCWPFLKEAGWLAKFVPNMYIDTCWMPVLNPEFLREGFNTWLSYVPSHKIMLAHDSTHIEMATGSSLFTREILGQELALQQSRLRMSDKALLQYGADMLQNNCVHLYQFGAEVNL